MDVTLKRSINEPMFYVGIQNMFREVAVYSKNCKQTAKNANKVLKNEKICHLSNIFGFTNTGAIFPTELATF